MDITKLNSKGFRQILALSGALLALASFLSDKKLLDRKKIVIS
ncbi:MAG: hypothetical protein QT03_C0001G0143 [archaeon GW2011_AR10]|nr:MAG: hypothetical protein QT03_C0001G0143 [archaeon GW2011_AR10]